jgi:stage V sporulation protein B
MNGRKNISAGAVVVGAGVVAVLLALAYRIALQNILQIEGLAHLQAAGPIYALSVALCTFGLPQAVSKMVNARCVRGDYRGAQDVFIAALLSFAALGALLMILGLLLAGPFAKLMGLETAAALLRAMSPLYLLGLLLCALRGYFEGMQIYTPGALASLIEQAVKLLLGLLLAVLWAEEGAQKAALGAVLGVVIGEAAALAFAGITFATSARALEERARQSDAGRRFPLPLLAQKIFVTAAPLLIAGLLVPAVLGADALTVIKRLVKQGYDGALSVEAFGLLAGTATPFALFPAILLAALAGEIGRAIPQLRAYKQPQEISGAAGAAFKLCLLIALPAAVCICVLAKPLVSMFFGGALSEIQLQLGAGMMSIMGVASFFLALGFAGMLILGGLGRGVIPAMNTVVGIIVKIAVLLILTSIEKINVMGAAFSTLMAFAATGTLNALYAARAARVRWNWLNDAGKPALAAAVSGLVAGLGYYLWLGKLDLGMASALIALIAGAVLYTALLVLLQPFGQELDYLPGGKWIRKLLQK